MLKQFLTNLSNGTATSPWFMNLNLWPFPCVYLFEHSFTSKHISFSHQSSLQLSLYLLARVPKVHRVDGAAWFPPADQVLASGSLARIETFGSWWDWALGGGGGWRGGGGRLFTRRAVAGAYDCRADGVTGAEGRPDKRLFTKLLLICLNQKANL